MDLLLDGDWSATWRDLVRARDERMGARDDRYWEQRSDRYALSLQERPDPLLELLEPWLSPARTLIDVGAGVGRHAVPLAGRLGHVHAVEPSAGMRGRIPRLPNLSVVPAAWLEAGPLQADLVICVHMLYPIADPEPFIARLDASARERAFIVMRDLPSVHPAEVMLGNPREPLLRHCYLLLRQMGIAPDATMFSYSDAFRFASFDDALADCRWRAGALWDDVRGRRFLEDSLVPGPDGSVVFEGGEMVSGILHWTPRG
jgi:SAM-dependent methyltransferase